MAQLQYISTFTIIAVSFLIYRFLKNYLEERAFQQFARDNRCLPPRRKAVHSLPWGIDVIREVASFKGDLLDEWLTARFKKYGPSWQADAMLGYKQFSTTDPRIIQTVLATNFKDFALGERRWQFRPFMGDGIFTTDGRAWEHSRALLRPQFARDQVGDLELTERHVQNLFRVIPMQDNEWTEMVDMRALFYRFTLDTATEFMLGTSVQSQLLNDSASQTGTPSDEREFARAFNEAQETLIWRVRLGRLYFLQDGLTFRRNGRIVRRFIDGCIQRVLDSTQHHSDKVAHKERYTFLEALIQETQDPDELRNQIIHLMVAGRDTTAATLSWIFSLLPRHKDVFRKLRREVSEAFGTEDSPSEITFEGLKNCRYLQHVVRETLRLYPPVPLNQRFALRHTVLPVGGGASGESPVAIRKGDSVDYAVYIMHRRQDIWGPDANEFRPERWEHRKTSWEYLPFNGGPRVCLGQQYALTQAGYVIVRFLQRFSDIEITNPQEKTRKNITITLSPEGGVYYKFKRA